MAGGGHAVQVLDIIRKCRLAACRVTLFARHAPRVRHDRRGRRLGLVVLREVLLKPKDVLVRRERWEAVGGGGQLLLLLCRAPPRPRVIGRQRQNAEHEAPLQAQLAVEVDRDVFLLNVL